MIIKQEENIRLVYGPVWNFDFGWVYSVQIRKGWFIFRRWVSDSTYYSRSKAFKRFYQLQQLQNGK